MGKLKQIISEELDELVIKAQKQKIPAPQILDEIRKRSSILRFLEAEK